MTRRAHAQARFTEWWVRCYTRGLPADARDQRRREIESDVFEQLDGARQATTPARSAAAEVLWRTVRGMGDDILWRLRERSTMKSSIAGAGRPTGVQALWATATSAWFTPIAALLGVLNVLGAVLVAIDRSGKMPGQVIGPVIMVSLAASLFAGLWLRWSSSAGASATPLQATRSRKAAIALIALCVVTFAVGLTWLFPLAIVPLGGVGALVVVAGRRSARQRAAMTAPIRAARRQGLVTADALIIIGVLPALALFWMVIPPILAVIVIGGVIGTGVRPRRAAVA